MTIKLNAADKGQGGSLYIVLEFLRVTLMTKVRPSCARDVLGSNIMYPTH